MGTRTFHTGEARKFLHEFTRQLQVVVRTGKIKFGFRSTLRCIQRGYAKLVIVAKNLPDEKKKLLWYLCKLTNVLFYEAPVNTDELGEMVRRPHRIASLVILDVGSSNILKLVQSAPI